MGGPVKTDSEPRWDGFQAVFELAGRAVAQVRAAVGHQGEIDVEVVGRFEAGFFQQGGGGLLKSESVTLAHGLYAAFMCPLQQRTNSLQQHARRPAEVPVQGLRVPGAVRAGGRGQSGAVCPGRGLAHRAQLPAQHRPRHGAALHARGVAMRGRWPAQVAPGQFAASRLAINKFAFTTLALCSLCDVRRSLLPGREVLELPLVI